MEAVCDPFRPPGLLISMYRSSYVIVNLHPISLISKKRKRSNMRINLENRTASPNSYAYIHENAENRHTTRQCSY